MEDKELEILETLIKKDRKIFEQALEKVAQFEKKDHSDLKKWEFVKCHINDVYYDYIERYDIFSNLENDLNWYGFNEVYGWLKAVENAGADRIVKEAIKDYAPSDWLDCPLDEIGYGSMEYFRPLW